MITIRHATEPDFLILRVEGHAVTKGSSILCGGVSGLVETLAFYALKNKGQADMGDGYSNITIRNNRLTREVFNAFMEGLRAIATTFPGFIQMN
jgi:uncharacterized protein YsxB (DUF464 family)